MVSILVRIITKRTLLDFWKVHPAAERPLRAWHTLVSKAQWNGPTDVKRQFGSAVDFVGDNRAIFDIGGNKYRLIVHIAYPYGRLLIKFVGTHKDYDKINPETV
jgi:mRNA interferase HigB